MILYAIFVLQVQILKNHSKAEKCNKQFTILEAHYTRGYHLGQFEVAGLEREIMFLTH